jgi:hypothetical protein
MWLGDTVNFRARKNRIQVSQTFRIIEISVSINDNGLEDVQLGVL